MPRVKYKSGQEGYDRLMKIDNLIAGNKGSLTRNVLLQKVNSTLEGEYQISASTLDKDINKLKDELERKHPSIKLINNQFKGYYYSEPGFSLFSSSITEDDTSSLIVAKGLFDLLKGSALKPKFEELVQKIMQLSLSENSQVGESEVSYVKVSDNLPSKGEKWIEPLLMAIHHKNAVLITYRNSQENVNERHISPYLLKQSNNQWYLLASIINDKPDIIELNFALDRIEALTYSNRAYREPLMNVADFYKYSLGIWHEHAKEPIEIHLLFTDPNIIRRVKAYPLHHTQQVVSSIENTSLEIAITVYHSTELETLILGFSDKVKVLAPESLVERIKDKVSRMSGLYNQ
jgi:predicted DNA-binding transcriptional regulator YafY